MKSGRAAKWAARVFKYEEDEGNQRFLDWSDFRDEFRKEFCPAHSDAAAINKLETMSYFQGTRSVDEYLDEFLDLIAEAGYTDPKTLVVKFRRGLNPQVQNVVATMTAGRPSDTFPTAWYEAARNVDQNRTSNEAFQSSFCSSTPARLVTKTPLSSKNRFDVLNIENIPSSETEEDVPTSENSAPKRAVKMGAHFDNKNDALILQPQMGAYFDDKNDAPKMQSQMGAYSDNKNDAPKIQSQMRGHSDGKSDALILQPQMGASFDDKSNALILPLQIRACLPSSTATYVRRPKWERRLPERIVIGTTETGPTSLKLKMEIETTDTAERRSVLSLVDSGATGELIDRHYAKSCRFNLLKLSKPIPVYNVDGTPNEAGDITEVVDFILRYKNHSERTLFAVSNLGKQKMILGHSWLRKHNPEIDWATGEVKMSRCPPRCCEGCRDEIRQERSAKKAETQRKDTCSAGPSPEIDHDSDLDEEDSETCADLRYQNARTLQEGDRLMATALLPETCTLDVRASSTISQRLAEAFKANSEAGAPPIPEYLKEFTSVFSKASFDNLPESREWDHAIEIVPGSKTSACKVYPMSPSEQKELDVFLKENLETGRIRPSKSPMASPVFFIKKKDGALRLVQDYRALNNITVKNKYPLPLISELINKLQGAKYFTKLDVRWGFNNVRMKVGDEWKAAFRTNRGLFEPLVMFFGLTNSPATFQTMMNGIFEDLISEGVVLVYLDDILVFTKTLQEHREVVRKVIALLIARKT